MAKKMFGAVTVRNTARLDEDCEEGGHSGKKMRAAANERNAVHLEKASARKEQEEQRGVELSGDLPPSGKVGLGVHFRPPPSKVPLHPSEFSLRSCIKAPSASSDGTSRPRSVSFDSELSFRDFPLEVSDYPCLDGPALGIGWDPLGPDRFVPLEEHEKSKPDQRKTHMDMRMMSFQRWNLLMEEGGYTRKEIEVEMKKIERSRRSQAQKKKKKKKKHSGDNGGSSGNENCREESDNNRVEVKKNKKKKKKQSVHDRDSNTRNNCCENKHVKDNCESLEAVEAAAQDNPRRGGQGGILSPEAAKQRFLARASLFTSCCGKDAVVCDSKNSDEDSDSVPKAARDPPSRSRHGSVFGTVATKQRSSLNSLVSGMKGLGSTDTDYDDEDESDWVVGVAQHLPGHGHLGNVFAYSAKQRPIIDRAAVLVASSKEVKITESQDGDTDSESAAQDSPCRSRHGSVFSSARGSPFSGVKRVGSAAVNNKDDESDWVVGVAQHLPRRGHLGSAFVY
eukprot:CAMPEP_0197432280 /NCGR_PEP_ID=MMETSP1175-20131217/371_1 /TAXON_ID=1003142 /ORGANISM="Triceratium dubium, Strain CCMP147" /LENGTH=507 /DNA_ID=CAMNT_0042960311 /DNA_START=11 /DNA_END=1534 /DNA_ORIENTATION=+